MMDVTIKEISAFEEAVLLRKSTEFNSALNKTEVTEAYYAARQALEKRCIAPPQPQVFAAAKREAPVTENVVYFHKGVLLGLASRPDIEQDMKDILLLVAANLQRLHAGYKA